MTDKFLIKIEKLINSELSSKILSSKIEFNELIFKISHSEILDIIQFLITFFNIQIYLHNNAAMHTGRPSGHNYLILKCIFF